MKYGRIVIMLLAGLAFGCHTSRSSLSQSSRINSYYDSKIDFSRYRTFAIASDGDSVINSVAEWNSTLFRAQLESAIAYEMQGNGHILTDRPNPDLIIFYRVFKSEGTFDRTIPLPGHYRVRGNATVDDRQMTSVPIGKGTLMVQLYDVKSGMIVWQGVAAGIMDGTNVNSDAMIQRAVVGLFNQYAAQANKNEYESGIKN